MDKVALTYFFLSIVMILMGYLIKRYLDWAKLNNLNSILGIGVFWLKFYGNALLIFGSIAFVLLGISLLIKIIVDNL